jgi:hypothetical protein
VALLTGAVHSSALVLDISPGGALLFPIIRLRVGQHVAVELKRRDETVAVRLGVVIRTCQNTAAVCFLDEVEAREPSAA